MSIEKPHSLPGGLRDPTECHHVAINARGLHANVHGTVPLTPASWVVKQGNRVDYIILVHSCVNNLHLIFIIQVLKNPPLGGQRSSGDREGAHPLLRARILIYLSCSLAFLSAHNSIVALPFNISNDNMLWRVLG